MGRKHTRRGKHVHLLAALAIMCGLGICGCAGLQEYVAKPEYWQADQYVASGDFQAAAAKYREIIDLYPQAAGEALFGMACLYANPKNPERDYRKSSDAFKKIIEEYPGSKYREPSATFLALLDEMAKRDRNASVLRKQIEALEKHIEGLQKQIEQMKEIDRTLEEKRRALPQRK